MATKLDLPPKPWIEPDNTTEFTTKAKPKSGGGEVTLIQDEIRFDVLSMTTRNIVLVCKMSKNGFMN